MTKKDYIKFAEMIKGRLDYIKGASPEGCKEECHEVEIKIIVDNLCLIFREDNPSFDRSHFLAACGIED